MIHLVTGDMLERPVDVRVNTVNCVGVMGKGVALAFKRRYPDMFREYLTRCQAGQVVIGRLDVHRERDCYVVNFPTKTHWRNGSEYAFVRDGLISLREYLIQWINFSMPGERLAVTVPALGCGHGGLDWTKVRQMIETALGDIESADIYVYQPQDSWNL